MAKLCYVVLLSNIIVRRDIRCPSPVVLTQNNGEIVSHEGFFKGHHYGKGLNCSWVILAPAGKFVEIVAENFSMDTSLR